MSKMLNVRLDDRILRQVNECRDTERYPTMSEFVRAALVRMCRELRRERIRADVERLAQDQEEMERMAALAEADFPDFVERWGKADRGEL